MREVVQLVLEIICPLFAMEEVVSQPIDDGEKGRQNFWRSGLGAVQNNFRFGAPAILAILEAKLLEVMIEVAIRVITGGEIGEALLKRHWVDSGSKTRLR